MVEDGTVRVTMVKLRELIVRDGSGGLGKFEGFSQDHFFRCNPRYNRNRCMVAVSVLTPDPTGGSVKIEMMRKKCKTCSAMDFAHGLSIPLEIVKPKKV